MILFGFLNLCLFASSVAQSRLPIKFAYSYSKNDSNTIILIVHNLSSKTFYYSIALSGFIANKWEPLLSDLNSLGVNEFTALKPLLGKSKVVKTVSKKYIYYIYGHTKMSKIRFGVMVYKKRDFDSNGDIIFIEPL